MLDEMRGVPMHGVAICKGTLHTFDLRPPELASAAREKEAEECQHRKSSNMPGIVSPAPRWRRTPYSSSKSTAWEGWEGVEGCEGVGCKGTCGGEEGSDAIAERGKWSGSGGEGGPA